MTPISRVLAGFAILAVAFQAAAAEDDLPSISAEAKAVTRAAADVHLEEISLSYQKGKELESYLLRVRRYAEELSKVPEGPRPLTDTFRTYVQVHGLYDNLSDLVRLLGEYSMAVLDGSDQPTKRLSSKRAVEWSDALGKRQDIIFKLEHAIFDLIEMELLSVDKEHARRCDTLK